MRSATAVRASRVRISPPRNDSGTVDRATTDSHSKTSAPKPENGDSAVWITRMTTVAPELR
jgi:hypothetical protein